MRSTIINHKIHAIKRLGFAAVLVLTLLAISHPVMGACPDIADIPLNALQQKAPGMIMFVLDDSGSMDWSMMCPPSQESGGVFNGTYYIFSNPGDDLYGYTNLEDDANKKNMWMSQWAGYNGMYYDPATDYTPWPNMADADIDNPRSNPMNSTPTLDMTLLWQEWDEYGIIVDNSDAAGFVASAGWAAGSGGQENNYLYSDGSQVTVTATWTATGLDPSTTYTVYARWLNGGTSRLTDVHYVTYDDALQVADTGVNQQLDHNVWMPIATNVTFTSGIGVVSISEDGAASKVCADAVKFVPANIPVSDIARRHYYVRGSDGLTYLVNLLNGTIEYYHVDLASANDNREVVYANMLNRLTDAEAAAVGIVTGRTYTEECQNFANWYSFYRRRELTAKNAIANAIDSMDGVYIGLIFINNYRGKDTAVKPVKVNLEGSFIDETSQLLDILYNYQYASYGTPLRNGLKKAGRFFEGDYLVPGTLPSQTSASSYPFFIEDKGGSCQMAFTVIFSDGYYNGGSPYVGNTDGDGNTSYDGSPFADSTSDALADVAMHYYERDLNTSLANHVSVSTVDPASHQHMVTYTLAFGVTGTLDTSLYEDCPLGTCPVAWPSTSTDAGKIDDMFHAAINGRGKYMSANSSAELNEALQVLKESIEKRLGSGAGLASSSIQRTVGTRIFRGTYNSANWYGEISALPLDAHSGEIGSIEWVASAGLPPTWGLRKILSYNGSSGIVFDDANLTTTQKGLLTASGLGTSAEIVDFIRGDTSKDVAHGGSLRTRLHPIGDIVHSAPTYFKGAVYIGSNDGMLHAVDADSGAELFTYVPGLVYDHLADLADPGYSHKYYVDGTPYVAKVSDTQHLLVCGLGKGGKGYFALDVTTPASMDVTDVLWEFSDAADMGYSYSKPLIVETKSDGWVVIVGNGYLSTNGEAILYVLDAFTGTVLRKIRTGAIGCNGLSEPAVVDDDFDGHPDYAFAGDLLGNMWKFDLRGDVATWDVYYYNGSTPMPLISVANQSGEIQPITSRPEVMDDCAVLKDGRGLMVLFGTGKYLNTDDFDDTAQHSLYGIWDWGKVWEATDDLATAKTKYLGTLQTDRSLSNLGTSVSLLEQTVISQTTLWYKVSNYPIDWYLPQSGAGSHMGWVFDLPQSGERCLVEPVLRSGIVVMISTTPSNSPCDAGGSSTLWALDACSGGATLFWDENDDGEIDELDDPVSGKITDYIIPDILIISDVIYYPGDDDDDEDDDDIEDDKVKEDPVGMFFWRTLER